MMATKVNKTAASSTGDRVATVAMRTTSCGSYSFVAFLLVCVIVLAFFSYREGGSCKNSEIDDRHPRSLQSLRRYRRYDDYDEDVCSETLVVGVDNDGGSFASPSYPDGYPSNANCTWLLEAPPNRKITVLLTGVKIEESPNCSYDYVDIHDGATIFSPSLSGPVCGVRKPKLYVSATNVVLVRFVSDPAYEEHGFKIEYNLDSDNSCNKTVTADEGIITSPNYPGYYPDQTDCLTVVRSPDPLGKVFVTFSTIDLEPAPKCDFDFVEIFDGATQDAPSLGRFCRLVEDSAPISSSGNLLLIRFHSDHLVNSRGFSLTYSVISGFVPTKNLEVGDCNWEMSSLHGVITSPNYPQFYENDQECEFHLQAPPHLQIRLTFDKIETEDDAECRFDRVNVYDGLPPDTRLLKTVCGSTRPGASFLSASNGMTVRFVSDSEIPNKGFQAHYKVVKEQVIEEEPDYDEVTEAGNSDDFYDEDTAPSTGEIDFTSEPHNVTLRMGESYAFSCRASQLKSQVVWMKDLSFLAPGDKSLPGLDLSYNHTLYISSMSKKLEGRYTCMLITPDGSEVVSGWLSLDKRDDQEGCHELEFDYKPIATAIVEKSFTFLRCHARNGHVQWLKNGQQIDYEANDGRIRQLLPGVLLIRRARLADAGIYACIATHTQLGCQLKVEAEVMVSTQVSEDCGQPRLSEPNTEKPHLSQGKIVGGEKAAKGSSPWQAMLWEYRADVFCGGSLVAPQWVVTAAHCISFFKTQQGRELRNENFYVKLGKMDRYRVEPHEQVRQVERVIVHPHYKKETFESDIALLRLKHPVRYSDYVLPICLGTDRFLRTYINEKAVMGTVTGWGQLSEGSSQFPQFLREIRLPVVEQQKCIASTQHPVSKNMFCAGYSQETVGDACKGDSGGPFAVKENHRWYLVGIVSWGEGCDRRNKYGFYTKAGNFYKWIEETITHNQQLSVMITESE